MSNLGVVAIALISCLIGFFVGHGLGDKQHTCFSPKYSRDWAKSLNETYLLIPRDRVKKMPLDWCARLTGLLIEFDSKNTFKNYGKKLSVTHHGKDGRFVTEK